MNHYCTYFDRGFAAQGLALWRSLARHDPEAVLWVLGLDAFTADVLRELAEPNLRVVALEQLEREDPGLAVAKANRLRVEYYFTLSPCWPCWLLRSQPDIARLTYLDADLFFLGSPRAIFTAMDQAGASILVTEHRFPGWLSHYEKHGLFNVGILSFRNDEPGRACLDHWRAQCLAWCYDRLEEGKYADQKYLEAWPARFGAALLNLSHPGVNFAPWNWRRHRIRVVAGGVQVDEQPLILFHFARLRPILGDTWWQSGHIDYGVMPFPLRNALYGPYWRALSSARAEIAARRPGFDFAHRALRFDRGFWRALPLRVLFGTDWLRVGDRFFSLRLGLGRWSGQCLARLRTIFLRTKRTTEPRSHNQQRQDAK